MKQAGFLHELSQILGAAPGSLRADSRLADYKGWDSMGKMAVLTLIDTDLNLPVPYDKLQSCRTVGDLLAFVGSQLERGT